MPGQKRKVFSAAIALILHNENFNKSDFLLQPIAVWLFGIVIFSIH